MYFKGERRGKPACAGGSREAAREQQRRLNLWGISREARNHPAPSFALQPGLRHGAGLLSLVAEPSGARGRPARPLRSPGGGLCSGLGARQGHGAVPKGLGVGWRWGSFLRSPALQKRAARVTTPSPQKKINKIKIQIKRVRGCHEAPPPLPASYRASGCRPPRCCCCWGRSSPRLIPGRPSGWGATLAAAGLRRGGAAGRSAPPCLPSGCGCRAFSPAPRPAQLRSAPTLPHRGRPACHQRALIDRRRLPRPGRSHLPPASTTAQKEGTSEPNRSGEARSGRGARPHPRGCAGGDGGADPGPRSGAGRGPGRRGAAGAAGVPPRSAMVAPGGRGGTAAECNLRPAPRAAHSAADPRRGECGSAPTLTSRTVPVPSAPGSPSCSSGGKKYN